MVKSAHVSTSIPGVFPILILWVLAKFISIFSYPTALLEITFNDFNDLMIFELILSSNSVNIAKQSLAFSIISSVDGILD